MSLLTITVLLSGPVLLVITLAFLSTTSGTPFLPSVAAVTPTVTDYFEEHFRSRVRISLFWAIYNSSLD
jgi:hypothetical protein